MKVLIDSDTIAFACAATAEDQELWVATSRADEMVRRIIDATKADEFELWLTGKENFRYALYPEYKANRINAYRPKWERDVKEFLTQEWKANWSVGCEADDMVGVQQCAAPPNTTTIAHIDKDINCIPGMHYNWELTRLGKLVRPAVLYEVSEEESLYNFYYQLIVGDTTDNIKGVVGAGPKKALSILTQFQTEEERYHAINELYSCPEEMALNARCLWLWRKMNDDVVERWKYWTGHQDENMASL